MESHYQTNGRDEQGFTVALIPDTQKYARDYPDIFHKQIEWVRDRIEVDNIKFAIHLGDLVNDCTEKEWIVAHEAMSQLDGVLPYSVIPGNHDLDRNENRRPILSTTAYNTWFPSSRYQDQSWYGGCKDGRNDNSYCFFSAAGFDFMVLNIEYGPLDESLQWAADVLARHRDKRVIVAVHCYMYDDNTHLSEGDLYSPHKLSDSCNDGEQIWQKLVRHQPNIFLVVSGHVKGRLTGKRTDRGDHGNTVHQLLVNYQTLENGGNGWLRTMRFVPAENKIHITAYSPTLDENNDAPDHTFTLDVEIWS